MNVYLCPLPTPVVSPPCGVPTLWGTQSRDRMVGYWGGMVGVSTVGCGAGTAVVGTGVSDGVGGIVLVLVGRTGVGVLWGVMVGV